MTSRLKHKLELENVNLKSAHLNESFVQIGTPLPALAENKKDKLEYVPEWQQEVRDEKGRRRFHGAFTGGFSAGYYNSVGSKEGWTPATFKSSRNNRATKVQRAEDFMDEEDLAAMNDDRRLENTETFKDEGFAGMREGANGKSLSSALESLIAPARTSIGQTLLQKQGWRPGQGIGPRVTLRKLQWQESKNAQAGPSGRTAEEMDVDNEIAAKHTFAPRDAKLLVYQGKDDREGLGYQKGMGMGRLQGAGGRNIGPSFGGAHRATVDEDDDPYGETEASSSSLAFAFDNRAEVDDDVIVMGDSSTLSKGPDGGTRKPGSTDTWHDGRPVLSGFELDPLGVPADKWFEMPEIPGDWRPRPARVWGTTRKWDEQPGAKVEEKEVIRGAPGRPLTFEQRGEALGEEQRVSKAKSVFEYMSEKERERLASFIAAAKEVPPPPLATAEEDTAGAAPPADEVVIPPLSPRTASSALRGYMPYQDDLEKQDRYRSYLVSQTYNTKEPNPKLKPRAGFADINKELDDFAASARIFKPMAFAMSSRFTAGSAALASSDLKQAKPGLHIYDAAKAQEDMAKPKDVQPEVKRELTPREQAADSGMYGRLTREVSEFYPVKLLCKRFGVADPHPEGKPAGADSGTATPAVGLESMPLPKNDASWESAFIHQGGEEKSDAQDSNPVTDSERAPRSIADVGMADDVNQGRDTLTYTKPSIDIFKAIFASDDEDDSDEEPDVPDNKPTPAPASTKPAPAPAKVIEKPLAADELSSFKPVYRKAADEGAEPSDKKKKKDKKKRKGVLSFDVGDDGGDEGESREERRKKRKDVANGHSGAPEDDVKGEWVEKPAVPVARAAHRKGAADFM